MAALVMPMSVATTATPCTSAANTSLPIHDLRAYETRLANCKDTTPFHSAEWLGVLQKSYGFRPLGFESGSGLMPIMEAESPLAGRRGIGLPFSDFCQPLVRTKNDFNELWSAALGYGSRRGWKYVEFRGGREFMPDAPASLRFHGHELDLRAGEQAVFSRLQSSVRRAIRKAENSELAIEVADSEDGMRAYYRMHCYTRKRHGLPPQNWGFFSNIHRNLVSNGTAMVLLAKHANQAIAGAIFLRRGAQAVYKFGASYPDKSLLRANNLVMWEAIKKLIKSGAERLHFGRTSLMNEGLRRFKLGWGATEHTLEYVKYDLSAKRFVIEKDKSIGLHTRIFQLMPMPLLKATGALLYRHTA